MKRLPIRGSIAALAILCGVLLIALPRMPKAQKPPPTVAPGARLIAPGPPTQPIEDVADLFTYLRTAGEGGVGQPVHLIGVVARGSSLPADQFVLLRYTIVHCVADAQPIGLLVRLPPGAAESTTNAWVQIDGTLASTEQGGAHLISVLATRITPTDEPPEPYLRSV